MDLALRSELANGYSSRSQIARVLTQDWVSREVPCLRCSTLPLSSTVQNTKARDFECAKCSEPYELKSTSGKFSHRVADGEYGTFRSTVDSGRTPNLLLLEYDAARFGVTNLLAIHRSLISDAAIIPRKPLSSSARRAGWQGCNIDLDLIPTSGRVPVVKEARALPWSVVRREWSRYEFMVRLRPESQGWLRDVLAFVQRLEATSFALKDVYQFEDQLAILHPSNQHVRDKIRQQLQLLVAKKLLRREERGRYVIIDQ
jgi:type II restriction enzyme